MLVCGCVLILVWGVLLLVFEFYVCFEFYMFCLGFCDCWVCLNLLLIGVWLLCLV